MNTESLSQRIDALPHPEPSQALDEFITNSIKQKLALENYHKANLLLMSQADRLDVTSRHNLENGMSAMRSQYGEGFDLAYSHFVAQQNLTQPNKNTESPELGL
jgi:hypothetical protein